MDATRLEQVLERHKARLLATPGVTGVAQGICDDQPCIRVFVTDALASRHGTIPRQLEGFEVQVEVSGRFHKRNHPH